MNKTRFLGILVMIMVVLNLIAVTLLFLGRPDRPGPHQPHVNIKKVIGERLHFSEKQNEAYEALILEHRRSIDELDERMIAARTSLYTQLSKNEPTSVDSQLVAIGLIESEIESIHYHHFADIKKLCTEEQLPAFNELTLDLAAYFSAPKPRKRAH